MGSRKLKHWITYPLRDLDRIEERLERVEALVDPPLRQRLRASLQGMYDMERLAAKACLQQVTPRDLVSLKISLQQLPAFRESLVQSRQAALSELGRDLDPLTDLAEAIQQTLLDEPSPVIRDKESRVIRRGHHPTLDQYLQVSREGKEWIAALETKERKRSGIGSLKVGYNRVFGYYLEVSKANLHLVPEDYQRKQTLVNGERFLTPELKEYEALVLEAEEKRWQLEMAALPGDPPAGGCRKRPPATDRPGGLRPGRPGRPGPGGPGKPLLPAGPQHRETIRIEEGRHPVIERHLPAQRFVPNSISLDNETQQMIIITGPNMAGKSTILRQTALIVLLAQIGSFVPAESAEIGLVDQIFTRVGASDDLSQGQSTFMVEMQETAQILHQATHQESGLAGRNRPRDQHLRWLEHRLGGGRRAS